ncbi:MAG: 4Fe-4S dicluster domain-containing protein [bacterium]
MDRREFLKKGGLFLISGGALAGAETAMASEGAALPPETLGVLVDTTLCIGCRECERACNKVNSLGKPDAYFSDTEKIFEKKRLVETDAFTVVNKFENKTDPSKPVFVKRQCMHCNKAACVSACIVGALKKSKNGAVDYTEWKCIGCRYCMMACPFTVPTFEFSRPIQPRIRKCTFCQPLISKGQPTACADACPQGVMTFGKRADLIEVAREKMLRNPGKYNEMILNEKNAGGASWMYMAGVPFEHLELPVLPEENPTVMSETLMHGVFKKLIPPLTILGVLGTSMWIFTRKSEDEDNE